MNFRQTSFFWNWVSKLSLTTVSCALGVTAAIAQPLDNIPSREGRSLHSALMPAQRTGGFSMDGYFLWCPSVIKVGDTFHLFASRWPAQYGMAGWSTYSECVRATSKNLYGPYEFQQIVLQKRSDHWDRIRVHNGKIVRIGGKFALYYISGVNETGYAIADEITGPWTRCEAPALATSNPAILVRPDDSVYVFGRRADAIKVNRGIAFKAPSYQGPYTLIANGENLLPGNAELEDPTIWWANGQYNVLANDWKAKATGTFKAGVQYFSRDGIHYELMSREPVFTKTVTYDDGTSETFKRRERPFVYTNEREEVVAFLTACLPQDGQSPARIVIQPVNHYIPGNTPEQ